MKQLSPALTEHLASGATTLCWCWRLTRRDGRQLGFTDHDRPLTFEETTFEAASGFTASDIKEAVGLGVDNLEVESALSSGRLEEGDLASGLYDDAAVEIYRVNWQSPQQRVLMRKGSLGEVRRAGSSFAAEIRGLAHYLQQPTGRLFQFSCDADLGDRRCKIDLMAPAWRGQGAVTAVTGDRQFQISGITSFAGGWFSGGLATFTSGANAALDFEVKIHTAGAQGAWLEVWQAPLKPVQPGDRITVVAGCDKQPSTCTQKFRNFINFRGFPHLPGNDFLTSFASSVGSDG